MPIKGTYYITRKMFCFFIGSKILLHYWQVMLLALLHSKWPNVLAGIMLLVRDYNSNNVSFHQNHALVYRHDAIIYYHIFADFIVACSVLTFSAMF